MGHALGMLSFRWGTGLFGVGFVVVACSASVADDGGCKKDTDCAQGRICSATGRCESPSSSVAGEDGGTTNTTNPTEQQRSCRTWRDTRQGCDCKCGTSCLDFQGTSFCGHSCSSTSACQTYMNETFGPGYPYTVRCEDDFCVFTALDAGT